MQAPEKAAVKGKAADLLAKGTPAPRQSLPTNNTKPIPAAPAPASANAAVGAASAAKSHHAHSDACKSQTVMARFARGMPTLTLLAISPSYQLHIYVVTTHDTQLEVHEQSWLGFSNQPSIDA